MATFENSLKKPDKAPEVERIHVVIVVVAALLFGLVLEYFMQMPPQWLDSSGIELKDTVSHEFFMGGISTDCLFSVELLYLRQKH